MKPFVILAAGLLLLTLPSVESCSVETQQTTRAATAAVYVYEKDVSPVPTGVTVGLNRLNRERNVVATLFEDDTHNGGGEVPEQYRAALDAARKAGTPALVVLAGQTVLAVVTGPTTADEIVRAVP